MADGSAQRGIRAGDEGVAAAARAETARRFLRLVDLLVDIWGKTRKIVLYVTHNLAEAVYLADRVIVLSPHRGTVKAEVRIALPRPRDPLSVSFLEFQRAIVGHLGGR